MVSDTGHRINSWEMNIEDIQSILTKCKKLESLVEESFVEASQENGSWNDSLVKKKLEEVNNETP
jgi:hypothetical protein